MNLLLSAHVVGAFLGLLCGGISLSATKGTPLHRTVGRVFVISMLVMAFSATVLAYSEGIWMDVCSGLMTSYFLITS